MNNFDMSSTGVNLELMAFKDTDLSRMYFDEELTELQGRLFIFTHYIDDISSLSFHRLGIYKECFDYMDKRDFINLWNDHFNDSIISFDELLTFLDDQFYHNEYIQHVNSLLPEKYVIKTAIGYSQGDSESVICLKDSNDKYHYENLFYNAPCYIRLNINQDEFYFDDYIKDIYQYDKDNVIQLFIDNYNGLHKDNVIQFLSNNLPDILEYQ